jgi:hypothetical protein
MSKLNLKCLLFAPICASYIFVVTVSLHPPIVTETHFLIKHLGLICRYRIITMHIFVPHFRQAKFCAMPSCIFDKLGCAAGEICL